MTMNRPNSWLGGGTNFHPSNWALYNEGILTKRANGSAAFTPVSGSALDWGLLYAQTSFVDRKHNNRRVQWGFQGAFALPRELFAHVTKGLLDPDGGLQSSGAYVTKDPNGTYTASVLGIKPLSDVVQGIRKGARKINFSGENMHSAIKILQATGSMHMELSAKLRSVAGQVGFIIAASPDREEQTLVYYDSSNHTVVVDRKHSTVLKGFSTAPVYGFFYSYTLSSGPEDLNIRIFLDGSLLEVYINDRFALTTRIYPSRDDSTGFGVFVGNGGSAVFDSMDAWLDTVNVWPERPLNSSSQLLFDTPYQTNNYQVSITHFSSVLDNTDQCKQWWVGD
jgi:beta-fructofuranosidase